LERPKIRITLTRQCSFQYSEETKILLQKKIPFSPDNSFADFPCPGPDENDQEGMVPEYESGFKGVEIFSFPFGTMYLKRIVKDIVLRIDKLRGRNQDMAAPLRQILNDFQSRTLLEMLQDIDHQHEIITSFKTGQDPCGISCIDITIYVSMK
jgi:hypothetical protein